MYDYNHILFFQKQMGEMKLQFENVIKENERYVSPNYWFLLSQINFIIIWYFIYIIQRVYLYSITILV